MGSDNADTNPCGIKRANYSESWKRPVGEMQQILDSPFLIGF